MPVRMLTLLAVVAICTERVEAKFQPYAAFRAVHGSICTGRGEAKEVDVHRFTERVLVAICTERVEAKQMASGS